MRYCSSETAIVDCDGIPAAIVAVTKGEPLVLLVSAKTMDAFDKAKEKLGLTHAELANKIRDSIWSESGQFHENAVSYYLEHLKRVETI